MTVLRITHSLSVDESLISERFTHASGPGGQNVNKVASAVILRFDAKQAALPFEVHAHLEALAGSRLTKDGAVVIRASQYRDQQRNREDARERLIALLREAATLPKKRRATKPTRSSKEKRLEKKKTRSRLKQTRSKRFDD
ncbi:MAG TPA: alternative ribosome rescue aminoacyl-tRNA hydrolase ArfB [Rhizomicrobium sp.]|nr:alternative ribosome rescue aminoacyl-tRNA hydrolase ArfB [Rhizomicrobium sp.]